jgi:hypothetical protein
LGSAEGNYRQIIAGAAVGRCNAAGVSYARDQCDRRRSYAAPNCDISLPSIGQALSLAAGFRMECGAPLRRATDESLPSEQEEMVAAE